MCVNELNRAIQLDKKRAGSVGERERSGEGATHVHFFVTPVSANAKRIPCFPFPRALSLLIETGDTALTPAHFVRYGVDYGTKSASRGGRDPCDPVNRVRLASRAPRSSISLAIINPLLSPLLRAACTTRPPRTPSTSATHTPLLVRGYHPLQFAQIVRPNAQSIAARFPWGGGEEGNENNTSCRSRRRRHRRHRSHGGRV